MRNKPGSDAFETFYKDVRSRLLLQTWALTGDLPAAQKAVRDALVIGWHHWRKIGRLEDPESFVRPQAWSRALRRHSARPFHRERGFDEGIRATLAALGKLPMLQRRVLLLAHLTTLPLHQLAREAGITQARAERELQAATAGFALARNVPTTSILGLFEPMAAELREVRWPRPTILTRAGTARRRAHTALGAAAALVAFAGSGVLVTDTGGARPTLEALSLEAPATSAPAAGPTDYPLATDDLLSSQQVGTALGGAWTTEMTSDNTDSDGIVLPCQQERFADGSAQAALARTLTSGKADRSGRSVGQSAEVSHSAAAARSTYASSLSWYAGCQEPRVQLVSTRRVTGVGDEATLLVLQDWSEPKRSIVASVARTGVLTTTVVSTLPTPKPSVQTIGKAVTVNTGLLASAVQRLCELPDAGACASKAATQEIPPLPTGENPAMLDEVDLPPVTGVGQPWMATKPVSATANVAATRCDGADFHRKGVSRDRTRSYVIPAAKKLPAQFGLTETIGAFSSTKAAAAFVDDVRAKVDHCPKRDLGTKVTRIENAAGASRDFTAWRLKVEISDKTTIEYLMAIVRQGASVAQVGFVPSGSASVSQAEFVALAHRAADRLARLR